jgi:hypothetical protein
MIFASAGQVVLYMEVCAGKRSFKKVCCKDERTATSYYAKRLAVDVLLLQLLLLQLLLLPLLLVLLLLLLLLGDLMPLREVRVVASSTAAASFSATREIARMRHGLLGEWSVTTGPSRVTSVTSRSGRAPAFLLPGCRHTRVQSIPSVVTNSVRLPARAPSLLWRLMIDTPLPHRS